MEYNYDIKNSWIDYQGTIHMIKRSSILFQNNFIVSISNNDSKDDEDFDIDKAESSSDDRKKTTMIIAILLSKNPRLGFCHFLNFCISTSRISTTYLIDVHNSW